MPDAMPVDHGDLPFVIRPDGTWLYQGSPITRPELVRLFARVLVRDATGAFWLQTPVERGRIQVEDTPFVAVEVDVQGSGADRTLVFRTNTNDWIPLDPEHPLSVRQDPETGEPRPTLRVRPGIGAWGLDARINRATFYALVDLAVPGVVAGQPKLGVWSHARFFPLGDLPEGSENPAVLAHA